MAMPARPICPALRLCAGRGATAAPAPAPSMLFAASPEPLLVYCEMMKLIVHMKIIMGS